LLWPQPAGAIISQGGDIDNRLKTLFDSLKVPTERTALPPEATPVMVRLRSIVYLRTID
jgi:hypothetical protein